MTSLFSSLHPKHGFHTTSTTTVSLPQPPQSCSLHLHFTLPPLIFINPYELAHHQHAYKFTHLGPSNLELPATALPPDGSALLLNVSLPGDASSSVEVDVPLHVRYGEPVDAPSLRYRTAEIPWPVGFFACPSSPTPSTPHPPLPSAFSSHFTSSSLTFLTIPPTSENAVPSESIRIPVGDAADLPQVEVGTACVVLIAFCYVLWVAWGTSARMRSRLCGERMKVE